MDVRCDDRFKDDMSPLDWMNFVCFAPECHEIRLEGTAYCVVHELWWIAATGKASEAAKGGELYMAQDPRCRDFLKTVGLEPAEPA